MAGSKRKAGVAPSQLVTKKAKNTSKATSLEEVSVNVSNSFLLLKRAETIEDFDTQLSAMFRMLTPLRISRGLPLNFPVGSLPRTSSAETDAKAIAEATWIVQATSSLVHHLKQCLKTGSSVPFAKQSLHGLMKFMQVECAIRLSQQSPKRGFPLYMLDDIVECLVQAEPTVFPDLLEAFRDTYTSPFRDIAFYLPQALQTLITRVLRAEDPDSQRSVKVYSLLQLLPIPSEYDASTTTYWTPKGVSRTHCENAQAYRGVFSSCWTSYLQLGEAQLCLTPALYQELLTMLPTRVLPFLICPLRVTEIFLTAFQQGTLVLAVQALSGLFYLLQREKLGDPQLIDQAGRKYYDRLLELLQPKVFSLPIRARFLRLLRISLQSKLLPTDMRATFVKKLTTVAVLTPPGPATWLLTVARGVLQRGGCTLAPLVYGKRAHDDLEHIDPLAPGSDDDDDDASNMIPFEERLTGWTYVPSGADDGEVVRERYLERLALWELELLKRHWCSSVSQLAHLFDAEMFKPTATRLDPESFLGLDTQQLLSQEINVMLREAKHPEVHATCSNVDDVIAGAAAAVWTGFRLLCCQH